MSPEPAATGFEPHLILRGRPPMGDYVGYVLRCGGASQPCGPEREAHAADAWRAASRRVADLQLAEAGAADRHPLEPLPPAMLELAEAERRRPEFQKLYPYLPTDLVLVDLDRVVVFQKQVNLAQADAIARALPTPLDDPQLASLAFGGAEVRPPVGCLQAASDGYVFSARSTDLRVLDLALLSPDEIPALRSKGHPAHCIVVTVGYSSNHLNAIACNGRIVLTNGTHRAYALRRHGIRRVPCVVQRAERREEVEFLGHKELNAQFDRYFVHPRPPLFRDYFDPGLTTVVQACRSWRTIRIQAKAEVLDVPFHG